MELPKNNKEFACDVSAMANAGGGTILIGISEKGGCADKIVGIPPEDVDAAVLRLTQILRSGVEPSLTSCRIEPREVEGKIVLDVGVPESFVRPHWVTTEGHFRFYIRHNAGKNPMRLDEIRDAFAQNSSVLERAVEWRDRRIKTLGTSGIERLPFNHDIVWMVFHICPLSAFSLVGKRFDPHSQYKSGEFELRTVFDNGGGRPNYLGWKLQAQDRDSSVIADSIQVYRDFRIEGFFRAGEPNSDLKTKVLWAGSNERELEDWFQRFEKWARRFDFPYPALVFFSLLNAHGSVVLGGYGRADATNIDTMMLEPALLDNASDFTMNVFKAPFDHLYQSYGLAASPHYDASGNWKRPRG